jgi:hypothetical protein
MYDRYTTNQVYVCVYCFSCNGATVDVHWFLYSRVERHSRYPASAAFERMPAAINSVVGTFLVLLVSASLGLGYLARSLAALVVHFFFRPFLPVLGFFFLIPLLLVSLLSLCFFFYFLFIVNNHPPPRLASLILLPLPLIPAFTHFFDTICHLDLLSGGFMTMSPLCPSHVSYIRSISILCTLHRHCRRR